MSKPARSRKPGALVKRSAAAGRPDAHFAEVLQLIEAARARAVAAVNTALIDLYWRIGEFLSQRVEADGWGKGTVGTLSQYIQARHPGVSGYSARNLWRMRQFFETYVAQRKLSPLVRELSWSHNLLILGKCKRDEEREFYLRLCVRERWGKRELDRQISGALFERTVLTPAKLSPAVTQLHPEAAGTADPASNVPANIASFLAQELAARKQALKDELATRNGRWFDTEIDKLDPGTEEAMLFTLRWTLV